MKYKNVAEKANYELCLVSLFLCCLLYLIGFLAFLGAFYYGELTNVFSTKAIYKMIPLFMLGCAIGYFTFEVEKINKFNHE